MKREPLLIWSSTLVALQVLTGGAALGDLIGLRLAGFFILVVAAAQAGTSFYIRGQVTPFESVAAQAVKAEDGTTVVVAGPASVAPTGAPVDVTASA